MKSLGIDRLTIEQRLALIEEIWDSITVDSTALPLTEAQTAELKKRIEEDDMIPDEVAPWEQVKPFTLAGFR